MMFMLILVVFMLAYAIGTQALLYPRREFYWGIFTDILYHPYWQMYGELNLDDTVGGALDGCNSPNTTINDRGQYCPRKFWPAAVLLAIYLLIVNILLVNLLIAVFTHVFDEVQANSTQIWKFELWKLASEFDRKGTLPASARHPGERLQRTAIHRRRWSLRSSSSPRPLRTTHPETAGESADLREGVHERIPTRLRGHQAIRLR